MTLDQIFLIVKLVIGASALGYIAFLYFSRKSLKNTINEKDKTIKEKEKRITILTRQIDLLKANLEKLKSYTVVTSVLSKQTADTLAIMNDTEKTDEEKDEVVGDLLTDLVDNS